MCLLVPFLALELLSDYMHHTHTRLMAVCPGYPGEPVPER